MKFSFKWQDDEWVEESDDPGVWGKEIEHWFALSWYLKVRLRGNKYDQKERMKLIATLQERKQK